MKRTLFVPVLISIAGTAQARSGARPIVPPARAAQTAAVVLERDSRGVLRNAPCARFDLSDPKAFVSDDTIRAKRCAPKAPAARPELKK